MRLEAFGITDVGKRRKHNEDAYVIEEANALFAVADGIGGAAAGEVASSIFIDTCAKIFSNPPSSTTNGEHVDVAFQQANRAVVEHARANPKTKGMGCTAELLTFVGHEYVIGHVGDSRSYLIRDKKIQQLTRDHSYIQEQIELGLVSPEEAKTHWLRNAINRAVGQARNIEVDVIQDEVKAGDCFVLCSDGLSDMIDDNMILDLACMPKPLEQRAQALVDAANDNGGVDNITVVLCEVSETR